MSAPNINLCSVCGKQRIVVKTTKEYIGNSLVVTTITSCPDPECQSKIDKQLTQERMFRQGMKLAAEKRLQEQKTRRAETLKKAS